MDNIITAANIMRNKLDGIAKSVTPIQVMERITRGDEFRAPWTSVRRLRSLPTDKLPSGNVVHIPLGKLREQAGDLPKNAEICRPLREKPQGLTRPPGYWKVSGLPT